MDKKIRDIFTDTEWDMICQMDDEVCNQVAELAQVISEDKERTSEINE